VERRLLPLHGSELSISGGSRYNSGRLYAILAHLGI
jgi:hypothetical protein